MTDQTHAEMLDRGGGTSRGRSVAQAITERSIGGDIVVELVTRAQRGDADAFDRVVRRRIDGAFRLARAILHSDSDAADAVQDAFIAAWQKLPGLRDPARFDVWFDRILVNVCRMSLRHAHGGQVREITVADPARSVGAASDPADPGPEERVADVELVRMAMSRLDTDKQAILVLHHVEGRPVDEIAAVLGIPSGTAKWRLHAARAELQRALEEVSR